MGRETANQMRQIAKETTAGTPVAANKRLSGLSLTLSPRVNKERFRAAGAKSTTATAVNSLMADGSYEGPADYNHIIWPLEGLVGSSGPTGSGTAKTRVYAPAGYGPDANAKTFTVEAGDAVAARIYSRLRFRSFQLQAGRLTGAKISGNCYANYPTDGQTLTANPTDIPQFTSQGNQWDIFLDTTYGGLGTTKIATAYSFGFAVGNKFNPFYALNTTNGNNMSDEAEIAMDINGSFTMMHDSQSRSLFATILNNSVGYLRALSTGPLVETGINAKIQFDIAMQMVEPADDDNDGVYGVQYGFDSIYDASLGGHWKTTIINGLSLATAGI